MNEENPSMTPPENEVKPAPKRRGRPPKKRPEENAAAETPAPAAPAAPAETPAPAAPAAPGETPAAPAAEAPAAASAETPAAAQENRRGNNRRNWRTRRDEETGNGEGNERRNNNRHDRRERRDFNGNNNRNERREIRRYEPRFVDEEYEREENPDQVMRELVNEELHRPRIEGLPNDDDLERESREVMRKGSRREMQRDVIVPSMNISEWQSKSMQELTQMGVSNIITFDAHDPRVCNAIPINGFDNVTCTYQMIKSFIRNTPDLVLNKDNVVIISPDEGGMTRSMYYSSVLKLELGMFYKRRDYTTIVNGRNPIVAHEYLGRDVSGKDVVIVDDMISSGDSVIEVASHLKAQGAKRMFVFATFGLFCAGLDGMDKAHEDGLIDRIFTTNLIYQPKELLERPWYCSVDLCKYVSLYIDTLNHDESISKILDPVAKIHDYVDRKVKEGVVKV